MFVHMAQVENARCGRRGRHLVEILQAFRMTECLTPAKIAITPDVGCLQVRLSMSAPDEIHSSRGERIADTEFSSLPGVAHGPRSRESVIL